MPPAFVLSQDQTLNKKFNLLLKLLWVFNNFKNSQKNCWIYFNYILFNFQRPYFVIASSDFLILSLAQLYVNNFFSKFFWLSFVSNETYLITYWNNCQTLFYLVFLSFRISDEIYLNTLSAYMSTVFPKKIANKKAVSLLSNNTAKYVINNRFIAFFYYFYRTSF